MREWRACVLATLTAAALCSTPVAAQTPTAPPPPRFEVAVGPTWIGGGSMGARDALETTASGGPFPLFAASTDLAPAPGLEGRLGVRVTRTLHVEAALSYTKAQLRTTISRDAEGAAETIAREPIGQLIVEGEALVSLSRWRAPGARVTPFVSAGAGYLRQLHDGAVLVETGWTYQLGGGVKVVLATRGGSRLRVIGLRGQARAIGRTNGVALDRRSHLSPVLSASLYFGL